MNNDWFRSRFYVEHEDPRPVKWPPPGPYWWTGTTADDHPVIVAYTKTLEQVTEFWPEAYTIDSEEYDTIEYTDRFRKPDWW